MNSFIKRNQKKILAIFSVGLMIAFGVQQSAQKNSNDRSGIIVGYAGRTKVTAKELHVGGVTVLLVVLALHAGAALKHHFLDRDRTLVSMTPGLRAPRPSHLK